MSDNRGRGRGRGDRGDFRGRGRGRGRGDPVSDMPFRPIGGRGQRGDGNYRGRGNDRGRGGNGFRGDRGGARGRGNPIYRAGQQIPAPDPNVIKAENALDRSLGSHKKTEQAYPLRPGYGTLGKEVTLYANYLSLTGLTNGKTLYRYNVELLAEKGRDSPAGKKARHIVSLYIDEHFAANKSHIATDYRSTIISAVDLKLKEGQISDVRYKNEGEEEYPDNPRLHQVKCASIRTLNSADLINYLTSSNAGEILATKTELITALNIILGHHPKTSTDVASVGANKHFGISKDLLDRQNLSGGLEVLRGFFISVRAATARVLLNVQVKYVACYKAGSLSATIEDFRNSRECRYAPPVKQMYLLGKFLHRMRIRPNHIKRKSTNGKPRPAPIKTIIGLAKRDDGRSSANPPRVARDGAGPEGVEFYLKAPNQSTPRPEGGKKGKKKGTPAGPAQAGRYVTVAQYFKETYNMALDKEMPVINVGSKTDPNYLPIEACDVPVGQPVASKLSPDQTSNMLAFAVRFRSPAQNAEAIAINGVPMLGLQPPNDTLTAFGVGVNPNLITVKGRVLPAPQVHYRNETISPRFGSWNMEGIKFCKSGSLKNWTFMFFPDRSNSDWGSAQIQQHVANFTQELSKMGIAAANAKEGVRIVSPTTVNIAKEVKGLLDKYGKLDLILGIMSNKDTGIYNSIKQTCDVVFGVKNVNVQTSKLTIAKGFDQYCANVGLKVNLKLGGANQSLNNMGLFGDGKTMLVGLDVTHPSPGSSGNAPSVAGIVASIDKDLAQWPADIVVQKRRDEMIADLDNLLQSRIRLWVAHNKAFPQNIVVYRDGVSEGQYNLVIDKELPLLKAACKKVYPASDTAKGLPRMAIIIVGKRHNTRFYPTSAAEAERSNNPQPGTVVDRGISEGRSWDWYQQAHSCLQGTARPAHYFTVWDEIFHPKYPSNSNGLGAADVLQELTHKMCYLFGRATKAVSVCPPAYYADLVCTRARCYLQDVFDPSSPSASQAGTEMSADSMPLPASKKYRPHELVKDTMFYI